LDDGLDGWSFMMRTPERDFALLYFEVGAAQPRLAGLRPGARYRWTWYDPREGRWGETVELRSNAEGVLDTPRFPRAPRNADWAVKIVAVS
jgi:hypothetical protein